MNQWGFAKNQRSTTSQLAPLVCLPYNLGPDHPVEPYLHNQLPPSLSFLHSPFLFAPLLVFSIQFNKKGSSRWEWGRARGIDLSLIHFVCYLLSLVFPWAMLVLLNFDLVIVFFSVVCFVFCFFNSLTSISKEGCFLAQGRVSKKRNELPSPSPSAISNVESTHKQTNARKQTQQKKQRNQKRRR